jgi:hypothetical protein
MLGALFDLLSGHRHLQIVGTDRDPGQRDEGQVAADQPLLDGAEHRLIGFDVDVDVLESADLLPVTVDQIFALPFADVLMMGHCVASSSPTSPSRYQRA